MSSECGSEPFRLGQPPKPKKKHENLPSRQVLLLVDMDDLPGQLSMFKLNGPSEKESGK